MNCIAGRGSDILAKKYGNTCLCNMIISMVSYQNNNKSKKEKEQTYFSYIKLFFMQNDSLTEHIKNACINLTYLLPNLKFYH